MIKPDMEPIRAKWTSALYHSVVCRLFTVTVCRFVGFDNSLQYAYHCLDSIVAMVVVVAVWL